MGCRVNAIPRPIPEDVPWYGVPANLIPFAGLLSFGSIFIELYYILTSLWNYKFYHVYGFLLGVYGILCLVVCMTTIIVVYFCLNSENYLWQWTAFHSGGSTALYVFLYSVYYFVFKTSMHGLVQTSFYFGYISSSASPWARCAGRWGTGPRTSSSGPSSRTSRWIRVSDLFRSLGDGCGVGGSGFGAISVGVGVSC